MPKKVFTSYGEKHRMLYSIAEHWPKKWNDMGYDVHITRRENFFDERNDITFDEWCEYVKIDDDMRMDNHASAPLPNGSMLTVESKGLSVWTGYSVHGENNNMAWFNFSNGKVTVKNPDTEILMKMYQIAALLGTKVQGDECEIYDDQGNSHWEQAPFKKTENNTKKWWQFWKNG